MILFKVYLIFNDFFVYFTIFSYFFFILKKIIIFSADLPCDERCSQALPHTLPGEAAGQAEQHAGCVQRREKVLVDAGRFWSVEAVSQCVQVHLAQQKVDGRPAQRHPRVPLSQLEAGRP